MQICDHVKPSASPDSFDDHCTDIDDGDFLLACEQVESSMATKAVHDNPDSQGIGQTQDHPRTSGFTGPLDDELDDADLVHMCEYVESSIMLSQSLDGHDVCVSSASSARLASHADISSKVTPAKRSNDLVPAEELQPKNEIDDIFVLEKVAGSSTHGQRASPARLETSCTYPPILRDTFPALVEPPYLVPGLSSRTCLRTCCRLHDVFAASGQAERLGNDIVYELYARIHTRPPRYSAGQCDFLFKDLYDDKPPYLHAHIRLEEVPEASSSRNMLYKAVGRLTRHGHEWRFEVMSLRLVDWEDVQYVAGIYGR